jgi:hypothetical protein
MRILLAFATLVAAGASAPDVSKLILKPAQVGSGYVMLQRRDGVGVKNTVTLDLCGRTGYPSESKRSARLQVDYLKQGSKLGLSNEVVVYKPGGAVQAMSEVVRHAVTCPKTPVKADPTLPPLRFTITRIRVPKLLQGYLAVRVRVTGTVKGKHYDQTSYAVYQRLGNVLSGTYSFTLGVDAKAQLDFVVHAAQQSAANLRRGKIPVGPPA